MSPLSIFHFMQEWFRCGMQVHKKAVNISYWLYIYISLLHVCICIICGCFLTCLHVLLHKGVGGRGRNFSNHSQLNDLCKKRKILGHFTYFLRPLIFSPKKGFSLFSSYYRFLSIKYQIPPNNGNQMRKTIQKTITESNNVD